MDKQKYFIDSDRERYNSLELLTTKFPAHVFSKDYVVPYKVSTSLKYLIEHIEKAAESGSELKKALVESILKKLSVNKELTSEALDSDVIERNHELVKDMMMFVFPEALWDAQMFAASSAYMNGVFFASPKFKEVIKIENGNIVGELNLDYNSFAFGRMISLFSVLLNRFYGTNMPFDFPLVYRIPDNHTGLDRYYKINLAAEFMDIEVVGKLKHLTDEEIESAMENIYDMDYMMKLLPAENFVFKGFIAMNAINITDTEIMSAIKKDLMENNALTTLPGFLKLQHRIRSLLRCPDLLLGLAKNPGNSVNPLRYGNRIGNSFLMCEKCVQNDYSMKGSIYETVFKTGKVVIIEDLKKFPYKTQIEDEILSHGIRSLFVAPLFFNGEVQAVIELGSPGVATINKVNSLKLYEVFPLFAMAGARIKEEMDIRIDALIKEKCTAIHSSLEWRFRKAAAKVLMNEKEGISSEMEEIVFPDLYPLYGLSDIRNSSLHRNSAIRDDMIENMNLAKEVILEAKRYKDLKVFDDFLYRLDKRINSLSFGIDTGEENEFMMFLKSNIVSFFDHLKGYGGPVADKIAKYNSSLDKQFGFIYKKRKNYEESALKINNEIADYLDSEQERIQKLYPHYFERYKTDGVEHNIYIGASLLEDGQFNKIYLKDIRLWQLLVTAKIAGISHLTKKDLSLPLDTAHLILVQSNPMSIRFRFDEKKFDVDGTYNVRYEIMKKRIDKAEIKGREERLTQPEKIAIVYSQNSEANEYLEYIEYMQSIGYVKKEIEELDLEELQGVSGLRALRVGLNMDKINSDGEIDNRKIADAVSSMN